MAAPITLRRIPRIFRNYVLLRGNSEQNQLRKLSYQHSCLPFACVNANNRIIGARNDGYYVRTTLVTTKLSDYIKPTWMSTLSERKCWKCGSNTDSKVELFFCRCGVVQAVPIDMNYFQVLGFEQDFDIDTGKLSKLYKDLQRLLHPDRHSQKSKEEQAVALDQSSYLNKAYFTLLKPLSRGLYLLELKGDPLEETNTSVDPEFLMEIMEMNENLSETRDADVIQNIEAENKEKMDDCLKTVSEAFKNNDVSSAKTALIRLKYFANIDDKIKERAREKM